MRQKLIISVLKVLMPPVAMASILMFSQYKYQRNLIMAQDKKPWLDTLHSKRFLEYLSKHDPHDIFNKDKVSEIASKRRLVIFCSVGFGFIEVNKYRYFYGLDKVLLKCFKDLEEKHDVTVEIIHDFQSNITFDKLKVFLNQTAIDETPTTVLILAHGGINDGRHTTTITREYYNTTDIYSDALIKLFKNKYGENTDFFSISCHGAGIFLYGEPLSKGNVVTLSAAQERTELNIIRCVTAIKKAIAAEEIDLSAKGMLKIYFNSTPVAKSVSSLADKNGIKDLAYTLCDFLVNPITEKEKSIIYAELEGVLRREEIDRILELIKSGDEQKIKLHDYGAAMLVALVIDRGVFKYKEYKPEMHCNSCKCSKDIFKYRQSMAALATKKQDDWFKILYEQLVESDVIVPRNQLETKEKTKGNPSPKI